MKNEHKIDYVSMHEDRDLGLQSFGNLRGALERGLRAARAGLQQFASFQLFQIFVAFGIFWGRLWDVLGTPPVVFSLFNCLETFPFLSLSFLSHF